VPQGLRDQVAMAAEFARDGVKGNARIEQGLDLVSNLLERPRFPGSPGRSSPRCSLQ
jgi:hypothetical protein